MHDCVIQISLDQNHLWKWIGIGSGSDKCAFSVDTLEQDSIRFNAHWVSSVDKHLRLENQEIVEEIVVCGSISSISKTKSILLY